MFILLQRKYRKNELFTRYNLATFGFLYEGYRQEYWYWEFIVLIRKGFLSIVCIYLSISDSNAIYDGGLLALGVLVIAFFLEVIFKPFTDTRLNQLESTGIALGTFSLVRKKDTRAFTFVY